MIKLDVVRMTAHRDNIRRFQRLLRTQLNELDRWFVRGHLVEEKVSLAELVNRVAGANDRAARRALPERLLPSFTSPAPTSPGSAPFPAPPASGPASFP